MRTTIKQLEWSEILSEGTFIIFSVIVSLLSDKGAFSNYLNKTRYVIYYVFNNFFVKTLLQYGNNAPSEMVSFYCVVLLTIKILKVKRNDRRLASSHIKVAKRMYQFLDY